MRLILGLLLISVLAIVGLAEAEVSTGIVTVDQILVRVHEFTNEMIGGLSPGFLEQFDVGETSPAVLAEESSLAESSIEDDRTVSGISEPEPVLQFAGATTQGDAEGASERASERFQMAGDAFTISSDIARIHPDTGALIAEGDVRITVTTVTGSRLAIRGERVVVED